MARLLAIRTRVALAFVAVISLLALGFAAPIAHAAPGDIDTTKTGSITIHKYANPDNGQTGNGTLLDPAPNTAPVPGVVFSYAKVDVDLTTNAGWTTASGLKVDAAGKVTLADGSAATVGAATNLAPTAADGTASVSNLSLGVYLVQEVSAPDTVTQKAAPFLVTIPFPNDAASWLYDVHVYPKNTVVTKDNQPVKVITDPNATHFPGDPITWTITQKVPALGTTETLSKFVLTDQLPAGVDPITAANVKVSVARAGVDQPTLAVAPMVSGTNLVTVDFASQLTNLKSGDVVTVTISAVISKTIAAGDLANQSNTAINDKTFASTSDPTTDPTDPTTGTPTVVTFAPLTINKVNKAGQPLTDAQFAVWPAQADGTCAAKPANAQVLTTATDAGTAVLQMVIGAYCVQEIKAPVGYEIAADYANPVKVDVVKDTGLTLAITNLKSAETGTGDLLNLPLTGAAGLVIMTLLGAALLAGAVGLGVVAVRRR
ncbi:fimbrial isopeptide formation D2 family protein/LPXTG-motif cell wall-anchored protein [Arcanobacterium wilhelmae]|uniref:Fimbrial isopeptide formation D2 family protein/LPXTG-motif cell wall-anchored protein n=1 Tax=Arcanobacterium wilhelmae TaxID=1803177 RepID=A0ABT9NBE7_9ACTO|nr:SpaH/EbpB family LPXTG-anchored major pilin [Arcanobacterium wilhelmae]MDP9801044.1 fimbrial isopeptide formation D2 family protein/LPXTG-motif cell wall-anchored protein [Arcanobacterium wilhelmae]WFN90401.1 SpaH/EbpB family LPXTG-anchored major pilin [Arcanobacterium wilhelmae]